MTDVKEEKDYIKLIADCNNMTRNLIMSLHQEDSEKAISCVLVAISELLDMIWYDTPPSGKAAMISHIFAMVESKCRIYDECNEVEPELENKAEEEKNED